MLVIGSYLIISSRLALEAVIVALVDAAKTTDVNNFIFGFYFFYLSRFCDEDSEITWFLYSSFSIVKDKETII